jgi:hypothetical protein
MIMQESKISACRVRLLCDGKDAETSFCLSVEWTSPCILAGGDSSVRYRQPRCACRLVTVHCVLKHQFVNKVSVVASSKLHIFKVSGTFSWLQSVIFSYRLLLYIFCVLLLVFAFHKVISSSLCLELLC